jgi:transcriptional regulator with XRE-family HTH domain
MGRVVRMRAGMKKLAQLREKFGMTQECLAELLKTTQQTVAKWESGKAEPDIAMLRDLALIFGRSIDAIDDRPDRVRDGLGVLYGDEDIEEGGVPGYLGLSVRGQHHPKWFPITVRCWEKVTDQLTNPPEDVDWFYIPTANNRMLAINSTKVRRIWLVDDAAGIPEDQLADEEGEPDPHPLEFYRGIERCIGRCLDACDADDQESETYRGKIEEL